MLVDTNFDGADLDKGLWDTDIKTKDENLMKLEDELKVKLQEEVDPIAKLNMEWELCILHLASLHFFKHGNAYKKNYTPTFPYPMQESEACAKKIWLDVLNDELGGWDDIDVDVWRAPNVMPSQLAWRVNYLCKYPQNIAACAQAPRDLCINPIFYPCIC